MLVAEYYYQQDEQYSMEAPQYEGSTSFSGGSGDGRGQDQPPDQHLHILPDGRGARCVTCNTLFKTVHTARQHIKLRHGPQEWYECSICKAVIRSRFYFSPNRIIFRIHLPYSKGIGEYFAHKLTPSRRGRGLMLLAKGGGGETDCIMITISPCYHRALL